MRSEIKGHLIDGNDANAIHDKSSKDANSLPEGFAHIRFEVEEDQPIIYIYEIQIAKRAQGRGLGKYIMRIIEDIAKTNAISTIMLTVFSTNKHARMLYESIGYSKDKSSPDPETGYIILSKPIIY
jgi:ribosomal protein S18 acetylase RimI-like enzyme